MATRLNQTAIKKGVKKCRTCKKIKPLPEFIRDFKVKWLPADCLECERSRGRRLYAMQHSTAAKRRNLKNGIDKNEKPEVCEECGSKHQIGLDHCHITGLPRGWLCSKCNTIIGFANDDPERLRKLALYLDKFYQSELVLRLLKQEDELIYLPI